MPGGNDEVAFVFYQFGGARRCIDGVEAAKQILEKTDVTIIFVTAYADDNPTIRRIRSAVGDQVVLGKPVTPTAIQAAMVRR